MTIKELIAKARLNEEKLGFKFTFLSVYKSIPSNSKRKKWQSVTVYSGDLNSIPKAVLELEGKSVKTIEDLIYINLGKCVV